MIRGVAERAETQGADGYGGVVKPNGAFGDDTYSVSPRLSEHEGIRDDVNQHAFQLLQLARVAIRCGTFTLSGRHPEHWSTLKSMDNSDQDLARVGGETVRSHHSWSSLQ